MLEAEGKLAAHLQIVMHDWPKEAKQNTIDHVLAALTEQRRHERERLIALVGEMYGSHTFQSRFRERAEGKQPDDDQSATKVG